MARASLRRHDVQLPTQINGTRRRLTTDLRFSFASDSCVVCELIIPD